MTESNSTTRWISRFTSIPDEDSTVSGAVRVGGQEVTDWFMENIAFNYLNCSTKLGRGATHVMCPLGFRQREQDNGASNL